MVPETSTTLLRLLASNAQTSRWGEFCVRYEPMMRNFLAVHFPGVEAEDVLQETFLALTRALPRYRYDPDGQGHFHNYLTGILRRKAIDALAHREKANRVVEAVQDLQTTAAEVARDEEREAWRRELYAVAVQQFYGDETVQARTKQIFRRITTGGETPESVAISLGVTVASVYLVKNRCLEKLRRLIAALEQV